MPIQCSLGHDNPDGSAFCDECGEPLAASAPAVTSAPAPAPAASAAPAPAGSQTCPSCGSINAAGEAFCSNCGSMLGAPAPAVAAATAGGGGSNGWSRCANRKSTRLNSSHANISYSVFCF